MAGVVTIPVPGTSPSRLTGASSISVLGAGAKGSYVTLIAATSTAFNKIYLQVWTVNTGFANTIDIAIGAAGSEVIIVPDIGFAGAAAADSIQAYSFDVSILPGTRIAARNGPSAATLIMSIEGG